MIGIVAVFGKNRNKEKTGGNQEFKSWENELSKVVFKVSNFVYNLVFPVGLCIFR